MQFLAVKLQLLVGSIHFNGSKAKERAMTIGLSWSATLFFTCGRRPTGHVMIEVVVIGE